jgi:hypothetical protein
VFGQMWFQYFVWIFDQHTLTWGSANGVWILTTMYAVYIPAALVLMHPWERRGWLLKAMALVVVIAIQGTLLRYLAALATGVPAGPR